MGASLSNLTEGTNGAGHGPGLGDIPESCVACAFMYLTPPEICNLARLNRAFRGAASSDSVWESKLPPNYHDLLDLVPPERYQNRSKKDIFAMLSRPVPFDDGNKVVWIDTVTGRVCMLVSAKGMAITGIEDRRYWNWVPTEESREVKENIVNMGRKDVEVFHGTVDVFLMWQQIAHGLRLGFYRCNCSALLKWLAMVSFEERANAISKLQLEYKVVAYLQQIWWFEVDGVVKFPFPAGIYTLSFRLHIGRFSKRLGRRVCNFEHTHGWDIKPVRFELSTSDGQQASYECCLDEIEHGDAYGNHKRGCWVEYKVGEFTVTDTDPVTEVKFSMKQIDCTHSKGGLCVDSVSIVPSDLKERKRRGLWK